MAAVQGQDNIKTEMKKSFPASRLSTNKFLDATVSEHHLSNDHSLNLIKTVYEKLEKHTSSKEVKLVNLLVSIRKMKCNTSFITFVCYHLFHTIFSFLISFISLLQRFLFSLTFTFFLFKFSHVIILSYCTPFFISNCEVLA